MTWLGLERRARAVDNSKPRFSWRANLHGVLVRVRANTKSEARAELKKLLQCMYRGVPLPTGLVLERENS